MSALRKKLIGILAVLFCTLLVLSAALVIPKNDKTASAFPSANSTKNVASLASVSDDGTIVFNSENLKKLYKNLSGSGTTFEDVEKLFSTNSGSKYHASDLVANAGGSEYIVNFGGEQWIPTFLSKSNGNDGTTNTGDIILTLWLADIDGMVQYSTWSNNFSGQNPPYNTTTARLPGVYGTSYVRAYLTGAPYANSATDYTLTSINDGYVSKWKRFKETWDGYLVKPNKMPWQLLQDTTQILYDTTMQAYVTGYIPNDSLGKLTGSHWYKDSGCPNDIDMAHLQDKTDYNSWGDDKVWLPSVTETGISTYTALWKLSATQRNSSDKNWLRSCASGNTFQCRRLDPDASVTLINSFDEVTTSLAVRPAIHLNLSEAENGRGIDFGTGDTTSGTENGVKIEGITKTYTGEEFTLDIPDYDKLNFGTVTDGNVTSSEVNTIKGNGEFKATDPETNKDKTYAITVTPKSGQYWDDAVGATDPSEKTKTRQYRITIELAEINTNSSWKASKNSKVGDDLLQGDGGLDLQGEQTPTIVYHKEYNKDNYPTEDTNAIDWDSSKWSSSTGDFTASEAGYYLVYYKVSADYHKTAVFSYKVKVSADDIKISVKEGGKIPDLTYGDKNGDDFITWLKGELAKILKVQGATVEYNVADYLADKELILRDDSDKTVSAQDNGYFPAGEYTVDFKDSPTWETDLPTLKIKQREITVKVVAATDGDKLTHVYGDSPVSLKIELNAGSTPLADGEKIEDLAFGNYILQTTDNGDVVLDGTTPVGEGKVIADVSNIKNYTVKFETSGSDYKVTQRTVKLKVVDLSVEYGKSSDVSKFKLTFADGESLVNNELLSEVITAITYSIKANGVSFNLSDILPISTYDLGATATADNYIFKIAAGKLTITMANFDMDGVTVKSEGYIYDGKPHPANIENLPSDEITVSYRYVNYDTGEELDGPPTEVGLYLVYATFTHSNTNYNQITDVLAGYIRIAYTRDELNADYPPLPTDAELAAAADLAKKKTEAKKTLDEEAKAAKDEIDADVNLSAEEKKAAKDEIDKELKEGNAAIDKAKDKDGVDKAYDDGKKEIEDTTELAKKKGAAKSELDKAAQAKKDAIDSDPNLTDEEKAAAKAEVDKELEEGKKAIDGATDLSGVSSAESSTKTNIENIKAEHKGSFPWWIIAVAAGVLLLLIVLVIVIVQKRQVADGDEDFYDEDYDFDEEDFEEEDFGDDF